MKRISIMIDDYLYAFYKKVGENAGGMEPEQVMADTLYKLAGELSMKARNEEKHLKSKLQKHH